MANKHATRPNTAEDGFSIGILTPHLEGIPQTVQPLFEYGAKLQSEFLTLWSHRAQAWLNWPKQALGCRTTADLVETQGAFLTTMQRHYREYFDAVLQDTPLRRDELEEGPAQPRPEAPAAPSQRAA